MALAAQAADPPKFETNEQEMLYFWGTTFGEQLERARITDPEEIAWITRGLRDSAAGTAPSFGEEYPSLLNNFLVLRTNEAAKAEAARALAFVQKMSRERGAIMTDSGLVYIALAQGTGKQPTRDSRVKVHYTGTLQDGKVFDSSRERGVPLETGLTSVIGCWTEAIPMMKAGGRARIICPPQLAYGERGNARVPGGAALVFDVELLEVGS